MNYFAPHDEGDEYHKERSAQQVLRNHIDRRLYGRRDVRVAIEVDGLRAERLLADDGLQPFQLLDHHAERPSESPGVNELMIYINECRFGQRRKKHHAHTVEPCRQARHLAVKQRVAQPPHDDIQRDRGHAFQRDANESKKKMGGNLDGKPILDDEENAQVEGGSHQVI